MLKIVKTACEVGVDMTIALVTKILVEVIPTEWELKTIVKYDINEKEDVLERERRNSMGPESTD